DVYLTPQYLAEHDVDQIGELMGLDADARRAFRDRIAAVPAYRQSHQIKVFSDIGRDQLAAPSTHEQDLCARTGPRPPTRSPCIDIVVEPVRTYPFGTLGAHAIGYLTVAFTAQPTLREGPNGQHNFEREMRAWQHEQAELHEAGYHVGDRIG